MHRIVTSTTCVLAVAGTLLAASAASASAATPRTTQDVNLEFAAFAGDKPTGCGLLVPGLGSTGQPAQIKDLRFFVSGVALITKQGRAVPVKLRANSPYRVTRGANALTLIDLENATGACAEEGTVGTNPFVRGTVPRGSYTGVRWTLGVPFALNHTDTTGAAGPLSSLAMGWSWQFGRKFTKIELTDPAGAPGTWASNTFFVHLGSTGCEGDPASGEAVKCAAANTPAIRMTKFDPAKQKVAVDVKALVAGNDITVNRADAPGCMSEATDPECPSVFSALGLKAGSAQKTFRAIRR